MFASLLLALLVACGSNTRGGDDGGNSACPNGTDLDGDGYGEGCANGPDCFDYDPNLNTDCCAAGNYDGCPCNPATDTEIGCFEGPGEATGNPPCQPGTRTCDQTTGTWGPCNGQVLPTPEECDEFDNDCDGTTDEEVQNACGNCVPGCETSGDGNGDIFPLPGDDPNVGSDGVGRDENGDLILDSSTFENHFLWIANDAEGTVSKIDTTTGMEAARYPSVSRDVLIDHVGRAISGWNTDANGNNYADNRPSRTAIDFRGDVWVANRAHDGGNNQPSITKIMNVVEDCEDRNGNGLIETSSDANGDGIIDLNMNIMPQEFFGEQDECVKFTVVVGAAGGTARALAIDQGIEPGDPGNAWVGMWGEEAFYQINGRTGDLMQRAPETGALGVRPYGAAIDSQGRLYSPDHCCGGRSLMVEINTLSNPATVDGSYAIPAFTGADPRVGNYGIVVDRNDKVWIGGYPVGGLLGWDPATQIWTEAQITDNFAQNWGVRGVGIDIHGNVWAALHPSNGGSGGRVARIDADSGVSTGYWDISGITPVGVGVDFDGDVWTVNQATSNASRLHVDQGTLEPAPHPVTGNTVDVFPTGRNPYTYSDFTGLGLRTVTRRSGEWTNILQPCEDGRAATWLQVEWDATLAPNTRVEVWVRVGDELATLESQPIFGPWTSSPGELWQEPLGPVPEAKYLQIIISMLSDDGENTPIVHSYTVDYVCPANDPG